jgi:hypothetical protein
MTIPDTAAAAVVEMLGLQRPVRLEMEIDSRRREIDRNLSQIESMRRSITTTLSSIRSEQQLLDIALQAQGDSSYAQHLLDEWEHLRSHPRLASADVRESTDDPDVTSLFLLTADDLRLHRADTGESRWLGHFEIELTLSTGSIRLRNMDTRRGGRDHPHVFDQRPCFGGHSDSFAQLMSNGDLLVLYELLIQFIETLNLEDEWGRYGAYWFEAEDEQPTEHADDEAETGTVTACTF